MTIQSTRRSMLGLCAIAICACFSGMTGTVCRAADAATADDVAAAARKASAFLIQSQNADGTFGKSQAAPMPGIVGLALKAIACGPDKPRESNPAVAKAVKYLIANQQPSGAIAVPRYGLENYNTSVASFALAALENPEHKEVLEKAKKYILGCQLTDQNDYDKDEHTRAYGAFGYGSSKRGDLSNTSFSLEALKAMGLKEDSPAWKNAVLFIKRCQDNDETNDLPEMKGGENGGGFVYLPGDSEFGTVTGKGGAKRPKTYGNMTYRAVMGLIFAQVKADDPSMQAAYRWIKNNYAVDHQPGADAGGMQGYYYYVNSFAKAFTAMKQKEVELADGKKANWASDLAMHLLKLQKPDGSFANASNRWMEDDPVLATAYALDALNLCYDALKK